MVHHRKQQARRGLLGWPGRCQLDVEGLEGWLIDGKGHALVEQRSPNLGRSANVLHFNYKRT